MREGLRWGMCLLVGLAGGYASRVLPAEASAGKVEAEEFVLKKDGKTYGGIGFSGDEPIISIFDGTVGGPQVSLLVTDGTGGILVRGGGVSVSITTGDEAGAVRIGRGKRDGGLMMLESGKVVLSNVE